MTRTGLSLTTAAVLAGLSLSVFGIRHATQGADVAGLRGEQGWKVTMVVAGEMGPQEASFTAALPPDFRRQHVYDERFASKDLTYRVLRPRDALRREVAWRRPLVGAAQAVRATYSFRCVLGVRRPTPPMIHITRVIDGPPAPGADVKPSPWIESDHKEIAAAARGLAPDSATPADRVRAFFDHVARLGTEPVPGPQSALECLREGGGASAGKSRLLVALCRSRGIPARLLAGLVLTGDREEGAHYWAEAWVNAHWVPMCPTYQHYGLREFPRNYLVLQIGDDDLVRGKGSRLPYAFLVQDLQHADETDTSQPASAVRDFWRRLSLYRLRPAEQHVVRFLLLLPLAALIVSFCRTVIGIMTFGTFGPALLGLAFLDLKAIPWGLPILLLTIFFGWWMRHVLERYHLLLVPRTSVLLTLIVSFLAVMIAVSSHFGLTGTQYISLFPLVILTHLVERFWTVESEDGAGASLKMLLGTLVVAFTISLSLSHEAVSAWLFRYPETNGVVLAVLFVLGRYTGYRLTELYRFTDLIQENTPAEAKP